jgi:hypothetical protein
VIDVGAVREQVGEEALQARLEAGADLGQRFVDHRAQRCCAVAGGDPQAPLPCQVVDHAVDRGVPGAAHRLQVGSEWERLFVGRGVGGQGIEKA